MYILSIIFDRWHMIHHICKQFILAFLIVLEQAAIEELCHILHNTYVYIYICINEIGVVNIKV